MGGCTLQEAGHFVKSGQLISRLRPFRRARGGGEAAISKKSTTKEPFQLKMLFRRRSRGTNNPDEKGNSRFGGTRASHSTHLTEAVRSSMFMVETSTFMNAVEGEETSGEKSQEHVQRQGVEEEVSSNPVPVLAVPSRLPCRTPPPESHYELKRNQYEELGYLQIEFDSIEHAREEANRREQPILCIEAEVPGSVATGETIFSHPLIVEAAESLFVTVRPTPEEPQDERSRFFSNSACRTRVRVLDEEGVDVISPCEHMSFAEVVGAMVQGLESCKKYVPRYLSLLLEEKSGQLQALSKKRFRDIQGIALFGMYDSTGAEVELAGLDGVLSTRSGALTRQKVVQVTYDSRRLSYCTLVRYALRHAGVNVIYFETNEERVAAQLETRRIEECIQKRQQEQQKNGTSSELTHHTSIKVTERIGNIRANQFPKPALRESILRFVPLTDLQACKANRLIHLNRFNEAMHSLSPRQGLIAMQAIRCHRRAFQDVVDVPIEIAWKELSEAVQNQ